MIVDGQVQALSATVLASVCHAPCAILEYLITQPDILLSKEEQLSFQGCYLSLLRVQLHSHHRHCQSLCMKGISGAMNLLADMQQYCLHELH